MAYTWHQVTEKEKEEIKISAKKLLDEFSVKLSKIKTSEPKPEVNENLRQESTGWQTNNDFRELMLDNAPSAEDGLIIAEKGGWKK